MIWWIYVRIIKSFIRVIRLLYYLPQRKVKQSEIIKNISYNQTEILNNIWTLYLWTNQFDCDITASTLNFYKDWIPLPKHLYDVCPQSEMVEKIEPRGNIPLWDGSIHSIVIDLPFVITPPQSPSMQNPKKWRNIISKRFASYYPVKQLCESYYHRIKEAYRVLDEWGICIFKCQSVISWGVRVNSEEYSYMCWEKAWFIMVDKFTLIAKIRLISWKRQQHSRSYTSQFLVFQKRKRKSNEFIYSDLLNSFQ